MKGSNKLSFPVTDLAFDKDRKPWGAPNDVTALLMLASACSIIQLEKSDKGVPVVIYPPDLAPEPVFHEEESKNQVTTEKKVVEL